MIQEKIKEKIVEINKLLVNHLENSNELSLSLMQGVPGMLLCLDNSDISYSQTISSNFNKLLQKGVNEVTFCDGKIGLGFFLNNQEYEIEEYLENLDTFTYKQTLSSIKENHDFLHGGVGALLYLIDRVEYNGLVKKYLTEIIVKLKDISKKDLNGIYWNENDFYLKEDEKGQEIINISLSHGVASKIVVFSKLLSTGVDEVNTRKLLKETIDFLIASKNKDNKMSVFPHRIKKPKSTEYARLAWCYGDLGISIALWQAGLALKDEAIKQEAIDICLHTTKRRTIEETGVSDAGICHGTSGIAHIYNRMYHYTKRAEFKEAADYWIEKTLKIAKFDDGLAGYKAWKGKELGWQNQYGLLEGIAGIGLVLLSHISDEEPHWDKCLLLS